MDIRTLSKKGQERMAVNKWMRRKVRDYEMPTETVERYESMGYQVKAYRVSTCVKGYYHYIVYIKR